MKENNTDWILPSQTCCFSGHKILPGEKISEIKKSLYREILNLVEMGYTDFLAGGATGFDTLSEIAVLEIKRLYPKIRLILALPFRCQTESWNKKDIAVYEKIKKQCDFYYYITDKYNPFCILKRNQFMVEKSGACICFLTRNVSGTAYTIRYAEKRNIKIINIADDLK